MLALGAVPRGGAPHSLRRWLVAPRGRFAPPPLLTFCGGRSHPAGAPLPLGAASVAAALALLAPASGRLSLSVAGFPRRLALVARLGHPRCRVARRARPARVSLPRALPLVRSARAPRALASLRSSGSLRLLRPRAVGRSAPSAPARAPHTAGGSRSLSVARGGAFHAPRGISPPVTKLGFLFSPLAQTSLPPATNKTGILYN